MFAWFEHQEEILISTTKPLAAILRPKTPQEFIGQSQLIAPNKPLWNALHYGKLHSMILWGPPGAGKTTLARLIANASNAKFIQLSAVMAGVKDIRDAISKAQQVRAANNQDTILFVDEVHRFNKSQQDAFLPFVEDGTITFIGATTENPSFALNNALLSRARVYVLQALTDAELLQILATGIKYLEQQNQVTINFPAELQTIFVCKVDGDARQLLNNLQLITTVIEPGIDLQVTAELLQQLAANSVRAFDNGGDIFHQQISALHKAVRGSNPDAALYWLARMLDGGCDPQYIARRVVRMASEDIGNADPRGITIALNAWDAYTRLGSPEGDLALAHAIVYLAVAAKSNAVYVAFNAAKADVSKYGSLDVPKHICNAPTKLMANLGFAKGYQYDHAAQTGHAESQTYFPAEIGEKRYYHPVERGLEIQISAKLAELRDKK